MIGRVSALALIVFLFAAASSWAGLQTRPRQAPPRVERPRDGNRNPPRPAKERQEAAESFGFVDWSYLQMQRPALVSGLLANVQNGKASPFLLGGLKDNDSIKELARGAAAKPAASGGGVLQRPIIGARPGIAGRLEIKALQFSPASSEFGSVVDGQRIRKGFYLRDAPSGAAAVSLTPGTPFRIVEVRVLDGLLAFQKPGELTGPLFKTMTEEASGINGWSATQPFSRPAPGSTPAKPASNPSKLFNPGGRILGGAGPAMSSGAVSAAARAKRSVATAAPFVVDVPDGAMVRVLVEFKPRFDMFNGDRVGRHQATLDLKLAGRSASTALSAHFQGANIGVLVIPESREFTLLASHKLEKHPSGGNMVTANQKLRLSIPLTFLNPKEACRVGITAESLPKGVRIKPGAGNFEIPNGKTNDYLSLEIEFRGDGYSGCEYGMGQEMLFRVHYPSGSRTLSLGLNILPEMRVYAKHGVFEDVFYEITVTAHSNGFMDIHYAFRTTNYWPTDAEFKFSIDGVEHAHVKWISMRGNNGMKVNVTAHYRSERLEQEWARFVQAPASLWLKVSEHL